MVCLAPRVPGESVGPRRLSDVGARPLNFTVRSLDAPWPSFASYRCVQLERCCCFVRLVS